MSKKVRTFASSKEKNNQLINFKKGNKIMKDIKDILREAEFGDKFMTRDGSMAIFWRPSPYGDGYRIITKYANSTCYNKYGKCEVNRCEHLDIISPWK